MAKSLVHKGFSGFPLSDPVRYDSNMCSTVSSAGVEAGVAAADTALTDCPARRGRAPDPRPVHRPARPAAGPDREGRRADPGGGREGRRRRHPRLRRLPVRRRVGEGGRAPDAPAEAARTVRTARTLRSGVLPNTTAALAAGAISGRHAAVIADAVKDAPAGAVALIEPEAVATAVEGDVAATANVMRRFQHALDPDTGRRESAAPLRAGRDHVLPAAGRRVRPHRHRRRDHRRRHRRRRRRRLPAGHRRHPHRRPAPPRRAAPHLPVLARQRRTAATPPTPPPGAPASPGPAWSSPSTTPGSPGSTSPGGTLSWAGPITASTAQRLGCDSDATFVTLDPNGDVVEAGTQRRFFTHSQILAMIARDGDTCPAPFCDRPSAWSDGHHLAPVSQGGTDHHRQRRPALRRPPRPAPRRPLDTRTPPRRPLPHAPPRRPARPSDPNHPAPATTDHHPSRPTT